MKSSADDASYRILIVDDNPAIHDDFRKILAPERSMTSSDLAALGCEILGVPAQSPIETDFEVDSAFQGREALEKIKAAEAEARPYSLAFMDVRMPPGWDGIETIAHIWSEHPAIQIVICTAYSDYSLDDIINKLGKSDSFLILKKPFDSVEVLQLAHALTQKWTATRRATSRMADLDELVRLRTLELLEANHKLQAEVRRRALMEEAIRESEERFRKAFHSVGIALAIEDYEKRSYVDVNECFERFSEFSREELINRAPGETRIFSDAQQQQRIMDCALNKERVRGEEVEIHTRTGKTRHALVSVDSLTLSGRPCVLWAMLDTTEQRLLEAQLRQAQKMEAVGQLAAGLAHDFNNLLTVIHGYASLQLAKANLESSIAKAFEQVKLASERAASLTRQLLAFSRKQVVQCKPLDPNVLVRRMESMLTHLLGANIQLVCDLAPSTVAINADESNLEQVIINLVINARDAMPLGGIVRISTNMATFSPAQSRLNPDSHEGTYVVINVSDNGCGMDEKTMGRIFEPFFTTKPMGKGTGLGLATVYGIVKQHEGWVDVRSQPGQGTSFSVFVPVSAAKEATPPSTKAAEPQNAGSPSDEHSIMVVEDEPEVRAFVVAVLAATGYKVSEAGSGPEAISAWSNLEKPMDLLLTDMVMPQGMSGSDLAANLRKQDSNLRVLFMSGYSPEAVAAGEPLEEGHNFLPKPFTSDKLLSAVRHSLRQSATALAGA